MDLAKLKKDLLREERRRRNEMSPRRKVAYGFLLILALGGAAAGGYYYNLESILTGRYDTAELLLKQREFDAAATRLEKLHSEHPDAVIAPDALFRLAEIQELYQRRYREAILTFTLVERDYPDHPLAMIARERVARIYKERLRDNERAIAVYQELIDSGYPDADRLSYEIGDAYFRENNFEQARIEFETMIKNYPASYLRAEAGFRIGSAYALENRTKEAEEAYRRVIADAPGVRFALEAKMGLAAVLEDQDRLREALTILEGLEGIYPHHAALSKRLEQVRGRIDKKKKAI